MNQPDKIAFITQLVAPLAASLGLEIWGVSISGSGRPLARIYVDLVPGISLPPQNAAENSLLPSGVSIEQCAELSRLVGLALDVEDPFVSNWTLEISSPGLERPFFAIDQLRTYLSREIDVVLNIPQPNWPGRKKFSGTLSAVADEEFTLTLPPECRMAEEPETVTIAWQDVRKANLVHHFPQRTKPSGGHKKSGKPGKPCPGSEREPTEPDEHAVACGS